MIVIYQDFKEICWPSFLNSDSVNSDVWSLWLSFLLHLHLYLPLHCFLEWQHVDVKPGEPSWCPTFVEFIPEWVPQRPRYIHLVYSQAIINLFYNYSKTKVSQGFHSVQLLQAKFCSCVVNVINWYLNMYNMSGWLAESQHLFH